MRERQSRMMEAQLEQATKRALEEEEERQNVERAAKSRKTEGEIVGAKERYLARKREAEEAKKRGE
jgi:coiled-coil domain-containing protein 55